MRSMLCGFVVILVCDENHSIPNCVSEIYLPWISHYAVSTLSCVVETAKGVPAAVGASVAQKGLGVFRIAKRETRPPGLGTSGSPARSSYESLDKSIHLGETFSKRVCVSKA